MQPKQLLFKTISTHTHVKAKSEAGNIRVKHIMAI